MADKEETEELIFEAACRVFQRKGYGGARMQEIADEADINKSMLHYYYRSKEKLFQQVFRRQMTRFFPVIFGVLDSEDTLKAKIEQLVDAYYSFLQDNPYMLQFVVIEMNRHPERIKTFMQEQGIRPPDSFFRQVEQEIEAGRLQPVDPKQLLVSIVGLTLFPFIARTMVQGLFELDEEGYLEFMRERRDFLVDFILNAIDYKAP